MRGSVPDGTETLAPNAQPIMQVCQVTGASGSSSRALPPAMPWDRKTHAYWSNPSAFGHRNVVCLVSEFEEDFGVAQSPFFAKSKSFQ